MIDGQSYTAKAVIHTLNYLTGRHQPFTGEDVYNRTINTRMLPKIIVEDFNATAVEVSHFIRFLFNSGFSCFNRYASTIVDNAKAPGPVFYFARPYYIENRAKRIKVDMESGHG